MDNQSIINQLEEENAKLKEELQAVKEHLKKYTAPASRKVYYEKNKEQKNTKKKQITNLRQNKRRNITNKPIYAERKS